MKRVIIACLIVVVSASLVMRCTSKGVGTSTNSVTKDSTWIKQTPKSFMADIPSREMNYSFIVECDPNTDKPKPTKGQIKGKGMQSSYKIDSSGLFSGWGKCDSLQYKIDFYETEVNRLRSEKITIHEPVIIRKSYWYDVAARYLIGFLIVIIGLQRLKIL